MRKLLITLILLGGYVSISFAQNGMGTNSPMDKLKFIVGEWKGSGWMNKGRGPEFSSITEKAECKLDCGILTFHGTGIKTDSTGLQTIVHDAFGIISYDQAKGKYFIRAYKKEGIADSELELLSNRSWRWHLEIPGGKTRFTTSFNEALTHWNEIGEFSRDGVTWMKILEMDLDKVK